MKWFLRIVNMAICAMATLCIVMFAAAPVVDFSVGYEVNTSEIKSFIEKSEFNEFELEGEKIKISDLLSDEKFTIPLAVDVTLKDLVDYSTKDENAVIELVTKDMINDLVGNVLSDPSVMEFINALSEKIAKEAAKYALKSALFENMGNPDHKTDEYIEKLGIDDNYLNEKIDIVFTELSKDNANIEGVTNTVVDIANDVIAKMNESPDAEEVIPELTEEQKQDIKEGIEEILGEVELVDDQGNIRSIEDAIFEFLAGMLPDELPTNDASNSIVLHHYANSGESDKKQEVIDKLTKLVADSVNKELTKMLQVKYVVLVSRVFLGVIALTMALWLGLFIFALVKIFSKKKPYIYMGPFFWIGMFLFVIVQLVLGGIPVVLSNFLPTITSTIGSSLPIDNAIITRLVINFKSSFTVSLICALILFVVGIAYAIVGHKVKKQYKREKKAAKLAAGN